MEELWNLLWSGKQQAFHIERMADTMDKNVKAFLEKRTSDYITLYVGTFDDCHKVADELRPKLLARA